MESSIAASECNIKHLKYIAMFRKENDTRNRDVCITRAHGTEDFSLLMEVVKSKRLREPLFDLIPDLIEDDDYLQIKMGAVGESNASGIPKTTFSPMNQPQPRIHKLNTEIPRAVGQGFGDYMQRDSINMKSEKLEEIDSEDDSNSDYDSEDSGPIRTKSGVPILINRLSNASQGSNKSPHSSKQLSFEEVNRDSNGSKKEQEILDKSHSVPVVPREPQDQSAAYSSEESSMVSFGTGQQTHGRRQGFYRKKSSGQ